MPVIFPRGGGPGRGRGRGRGGGSRGGGRGGGRGGRRGGGRCSGGSDNDSSQDNQSDMTISAGRKGATSKRNRKSSNDRDSRLCGVVVHTTPPSHDAAAAQVNPAAATASAGWAVTSVAAAPAAASNAAVEAFTEYDGYIEFDNVVDDGGGWGAYGDEMTGESSGRSLLTPRHNEITTAYAATAGVSQDQGGYDSDIVEVFTPPPPTGALKGNLPPGFVRIVDDIKLRMLSKLDVNSSASNVDAFGKSTLKGIIDDIVDVKNNLLLYAEQVHPICRDMLDDAIPNRVSPKTKKHDICKYLVEMWDIFKYLLTKKDLSTVARGNQIYKFLPMMEKLEGKVKLLIERAEEADQNSKSLKIPDEMMNRNHLESGSFKVDYKLYPS